MQFRRTFSIRSLPFVTLLALLPSCGDDVPTTSTSSSSGSGGENVGGSGGAGGQGGNGGNAGNGGSGGSSCTPGSTQFCYSGPDGTQVVGMCRAGLAKCLADGTGYGPCEGEVVPAPETCTTMGDDDCDGQVNEDGAGCVCVPNSMANCYSGPMNTLDVGDCHGGTQVCNAEGTAYGPCTGDVVPQTETCLSVGDEDCDGQVNEDGMGCICAPNSTTTCYSGPMNTLNVGDCHGGTKACNAQGTAYGPCVGEVIPQDETCMQIGDEDCDGQINESGAGCVCLPNSVSTCYSGPAGTAGVGICQAGSKTCNAQGTSFGPCVGEVLPQAESCMNATDDDCNGQVNESGAGCVCLPNSTTSCYSGPAGTQGVGVCLSGTKTCNALGTAYGPCTGEVLPQTETCMNLVDDDCDGQINESGAGCVCLPNSTTSCYTGPAGTQGIGICQGGMGTCNAQGTGYGACTGQVVPLVESCATQADDDCDGVANEGCTWMKSFGDTVDQDVTDIAVDAQGNSYLVGTFTGTIDLGGGPLMTPNVSSDIFVAKFDALGNHVWSRRFGANGVDAGRSIAVDSNGDVIVTGVFQSTVDFGGGPYVSVLGTSDIILLKLSGAGAHIWSKPFGSTGGDDGSAVTVDNQNNVLLAGHFRGTVDFGGGGLTSAGLDDAFVAKYSAAGIHQWSVRWGDANDQAMRNIATDNNGNVYFTGAFIGDVDFGGGTFVNGGAAGTQDGMIVKLTSGGTHQWSRQLAGSGQQIGQSLAIDSNGDVLVTGAFFGATDFGLGSVTSAGNGDIFVAKYSASNTPIWVRSFGDAADQAGLSLATDPQRNVLVTGRMQGSVDFGGGALVGAGGNDIFVAKLNSTGTHVWSIRGGDATEQWGRSIATDSASSVYVVGRFQGALNLGPGPATSSGGYDGFFAKLAP